MTNLWKTTVSAATLALFLTGTTSAFACGGDDHKKDEKNPSAQDSSALCGGEGKKDSKEPSPSCGGDDHKKDEKNPSVQALCDGEGKKKSDDKS